MIVLDFTMQITLNGQTKEVLIGTTAAALVQELDIVNGRFAIEVNEEILPRSEYDLYVLKPQDRVEIIHAVGGG